MNQDSSNTLKIADVLTIDSLMNGSLRRLASKYLTERRARQEITVSTRNRQRYALEPFIQSYGNRPVKNMSARDIERWMATRGHLSPATRRSEVAVVRCFVKWLRVQGKLTNDPMLHIKNPSLPRRVPRALSKIETDLVWAVLPDDRARAIYALMRFLGLRRDEVRTLQVGDWDRTLQVILVIGKAGHQRLVPVTTATAEILTRYVATHRASSGPMIRRVDGLTAISNSYLQKMTRQWMEDSGVKQAPHDGRACHSFRHTIASEVADVEPDLRIVQQLLGHVALSSTQIYLRHSTMAQVRAAMEVA